MKKNRWAALILIVIYCVVLSSCEKPQTTIALSPQQMADRLLDSQAAAPDMHRLMSDDADFATYLTSNYLLDGALLKDGAILYAGGAQADEIAVLVLNNISDVGIVEQALGAYIEARISAFYGYVPEAVPLLENAVITTQGAYVVLLICADPGEAEAAFIDLFQETGDQPLVDSYAPSAILDAWQTGDTSALSDKNRRILEEASRIIEEVVDDSMTDYEKELAIHDWIILWADYDTEAINQSPGANPDPDNDNPYGVLVGQRAICSGYTSTFQLFMDLLGIECLTVTGTAYADRQEHAWNMVRLEGAWYCVDVTWDDPVSSSDVSGYLHHQYFNVTSSFMAATEHDWATANFPEATATAFSWQG